MYKSPAHEICDKLGFTPEMAQTSAEAVAARVDRVDNWQDVQTTATIAGQTTIHLHQKATGPDGDTWIILGLNDETVGVTRLRGPTDGNGVGFEDSRNVSHGRFIMDYDPQTESVTDTQSGATEEVPVWGY